LYKKQEKLKIFKLLKTLRKSAGGKQLVHFTRQLATLVAAGLPLVKSLQTLYSQLEEGYLKEVVGTVAEDVEAGNTFSSSLTRFPKVFPSLFVNMVKAAELGGMLDEVLRRLADFLEKQHRLRERIRSALVYPAFVLGIAVIILSILIVFVVPTFTKMFAELGGMLPLPTRLLIGTSNFCREKWYLVILTLACLAFFYRILTKDPRRKILFDKLRLRLPVFGRLLQEVCIARFARTLGTLLSSGVSILVALDVVRETVGNEVIASAVTKVRESIKEGESVANPLQLAGVFPPLVVKMVSIGEETGQLDKMLVQIANEYEEEVDLTVASLTALLEPVLIVTMGIIVGFIVISMFLPLFALARLIGG
jgi:type IV pilus assembly protein PilC